MARIVVLNGTSSSGKTTIARAFQEVADSLFLNFSIDNILSALPPGVIERLVAGKGIPGLPVKEMHAAFFACVRELAALGRDLVIDDAITTRELADLLLAAVVGHEVLLVSVTAPAHVLEERERARGDRTIGMAVWQLEKVDRWFEYDLRIDTSVTTPEEAAAQIAERLERRRPAG